MNYSTVKNLSWVNAAHTAIECTVNFEGLGEVPFMAEPTDGEEHGREIFARASAGEFGTVVEFSPTEMNVQEKIVALGGEVQEALDKKAVELGFSDMKDALTYVDEAVVPEYQTQAQALRRWRSLCWAWYDAAVPLIIDSDTVEDLLTGMPSFSL